MMHGSWEAQRSVALVQGHKIIKSEDNIELLTEIVVRHVEQIDGSFEKDDFGTQVYRLSGEERLIADLRATGLDNWADWFVARDYARSSSTLPTDVAVDLLMGRAAGLHFGQDPIQPRLSRAVQIMRAFTDAWDEFAPAAAKRIGDEPKRENTLLALLKCQVNSFTMAPRHMASVHGANTCMMVQSFCESARLSDVWQEQPFVGGFVVRHSIAFDVLRRCNADAFLEILDAFPHPEPARQIMAHVADQADFDQLLHLLRVSPPAFGDDGRWIVRVKTPFLILANIAEKLADFSPAPENGAAAPPEQFQSAVRSVLGVLATRPDAVWFGYAWLQQLVSAARLGSRRRRVAGNIVDEAYLFVLVETAKSLPARHDAIEWVTDELELWRRERAVAAIAGVTLEKPNGHNAGALVIEQVLTRELLLSVELRAATGHWSKPERFLIGTCIASFPSPEQWFAALWRKLMPVRDRARHSFDWRDHSPEIDEIVISWSLCGLDRIPQHSPSARLFWLDLHRAIRESALTHVSIPSEWRSEYCFLAGLLASRLVGNLEDVAARADLRDLLAPLLCVDIRLADVLLALRTMNVPVARIVEAVPDSGLLIYLVQRIAEEQADLDRRRQDLVGAGLSNHKRIEALAAELSAALVR